MNRHLIPNRHAVAIVLVLATIHCAKSPPQLSPVGDIAFYARRVIQAVATLQDAAIEAEKAKALSTNDARAVITATGVAGKAGVELAKALEAGVAGETAKQKAALAISAALAGVPAQLSPEGRVLVEPYIQVVRTLLTVFTP